MMKNLQSGNEFHTGMNKSTDVFKIQSVNLVSIWEFHRTKKLIRFLGNWNFKIVDDCR